MPPMLQPADLHEAPNALVEHYRAFLDGERILLSGHSHQAWPNVAREGMAEAFDDAARHVDEKWSRAFARAERVATGFRTLLGGADGDIGLGPSTHDLLVKFLSALDLRRRPRIVITDGEFHAISRQMRRLEEEGIEIVRVPAGDLDALPDALAGALDDRTAVVMVSAVFFQSSRIARGLDHVQRACDAAGIPLLVDAYHALGVVPFSLEAWGLEGAYVVGGGYKYLQLGEGNCFLRTPPGCELRPVITGWFADFSGLDADDPTATVAYGPGGMRFAGATYDPTAHYRAARVMDFFEDRGLTPALLRDVSQHQLGVIADTFDGLGIDDAILTRDRDVSLSELGGFLTLRTPRARDLVAQLRRLGVHTDARGDRLRLGPAPYLDDDVLRRGVMAIREAVAALS